MLKKGAAQTLLSHHLSKCHIVEIDMLWLIISVMKSMLIVKCYRKQSEPRHLISNDVAFRQVSTQTSLCSSLSSEKTQNVVWSVA